MLDPTKSLTPEQLSFFANEGYLIVPDVFDPADLEPLRNELEEMIDREVQRLYDEGRIQDRHEELDFDRRLGAIYHDAPEVGEHILRFMADLKGGGLNVPEMFSMMSHPKLLGAVSSILGSEEVIGSSVYRLRVKLPEVGSGNVPWHQDAGYYAEHCDSQMIITCWVPLVDATVENGCMQILPRTHKVNGPLALHHTGGNANFLVINDEDLPADPRQAVAAECPRGGVVFMTNRTPHCSTPNTSDHIRWSVDLRYQSEDVPSNMGVWPEKIDEQGQADDAFYEKINVACYPPEADFLVHSAKHPEKVTGYDEYLKYRDVYSSAERSFASRDRWPAGGVVK